MDSATLTIDCVDDKSDGSLEMLSNTKMKESVSWGHSSGLMSAFIGSIHMMQLSHMHLELDSRMVSVALDRLLKAALEDMSRIISFQTSFRRNKKKLRRSHLRGNGSKKGKGAAPRR
jgi:hypothetical protein